MIRKGQPEQRSCEQLTTQQAEQLLGSLAPEQIIQVVTNIFDNCTTEQKYNMMRALDRATRVSKLQEMNKSVNVNKLVKGE